MSAEEIQRRIDELSANIVRQKVVLKQLETRKGAAQRQLNAIRDPVARLPFEISSEIFIRCLPSRPKPRGRYIPMLFLDICNAWADIAISTPALWASIHMEDSVVYRASLPTLYAWLKRSGTRPLSISLPKCGLHIDVASAIGSCVDRLQNLAMYDEPNFMGLLTSNAPRPFTFLKTLTIAGLGGDVDAQLTATTLQMLRAFPNLVECTFDRIFYAEDVYAEDDNVEEHELVFPHLEHLKFGNYPDSYSSDLIMTYISTPCLQTLHLPLYDLNLPGLLEFLKRCSPPLRKIVLGSDASMLVCTMNQMEECLALLPQLTQVELIRPTDHVADRFVMILADSPHLVPTLSNVSLRRFNPTPTWYQKLSTALSVRHQHIDFVQVELSSRHESPAEDTCVALRQLAADGMSIHIGTAQHNYI
ncbi:hypothetical protein DFH09DRAFT_1372016 [Mycena vulgaris]|nr:hypothetical protein DFH09DRAFT_1372016 [Mycena vulgaris]